MCGFILVGANQGNMCRVLGVHCWLLNANGSMMPLLFDR